MKTTAQWADYLLNECHVFEAEEVEKEEELELDKSEEEETEVDVKKVEKAYDKLVKLVAKLDEDQAKKFEGVIADIKKALGKEEEEEEKEDKE